MLFVETTGQQGIWKQYNVGNIHQQFLEMQKTYNVLSQMENNGNLRKFWLIKLLILICILETFKQLHIYCVRLVTQL